jgi:hypothetical protein
MDSPNLRTHVPLDRRQNCGDERKKGCQATSDLMHFCLLCRIFLPLSELADPHLNDVKQGFHHFPWFCELPQA